MIQSLSIKYRTCIAWSLLFIFYGQLLFPMIAAARKVNSVVHYTHVIVFDDKPASKKKVTKHEYHPPVKKISETNIIEDLYRQGSTSSTQNLNIGGPGSPEASSFKAMGGDNLVNLFTGDFSYSIPLLDVGGYPVNLFYNGGISMEQEASWVGLGWNINPGTVSRNMRGVPDDFNGTDLLTVTQNVKPNRTWGGEVGVDGELIGIKTPEVKLALGFSYNNYLGPAIDLGATLSLSLATINNIRYEKSATANLGFTADLGAKVSSRSGFTFSPSLNARLPMMEKSIGVGVGLSTSYNSRTGVKDITLSSQTYAYNEQSSVKSREESRSYTETTSRTIGSSTFSFARPTYLPSMRMPMENSNLAGQLELGGGIFGFRGSATGNGYYSESIVAPEARLMTKPLVGFMYSEKAVASKEAVMDFNRLNDAEVTPNTPIISAPQYAYDIFSIQGEGTGGSIRAYRGDLGFMRDNTTRSKDKSFSLGADIAPPGHFGGNWNRISSPTSVGGWEDANNTLLRTAAFDSVQTGLTFEHVYFKNPGETTVTNDSIINRMGGDNLVRFKLGGSNVSPRLESGLEMFNKKTGTAKSYLPLATDNIQTREKRTQVTTMLTAKEASEVGLEKTIRDYTGEFDANKNIVYNAIERVSNYRKAHHISEINVLEQNGMRYVYGIPVYSVRQKDFTFSVGNVPVSGVDNLVAYDTTHEPTMHSGHMANSSKIDGYVQNQETPAYASSFLLTGLLSPDYVDVTGNGITEDDLGGAVKFNYAKSTDLHKWRTPRKNVFSGSYDLAHFNEGIRTEKKDNKATISYGEREAWYLHSIESKSMVAIFKTTMRNDAKGVKGYFDGSVNGSENANRKLSRIDVYTKAEVKAQGINNARPLKSVFFDYGYSLCKGTPDNVNGGKLTLKSVYFTYNDQERNNKDRYVFNYGDTTTISSLDDPGYKYNASDRWGTYKDTTRSYNPSTLSNLDFPYTDTSKAKADAYSGAWSLKKILLPSGGQMEIDYEADDYAYVQNRRACNMFNIYGLGRTSDFSSGNGMYRGADATLDNYYVYIRLPENIISSDPLKRKREIFTKYLEGIEQLAFKLHVEMPGGDEPLTVYANYDDYGFCTNSGNKDMMYLKLRPVEGKSPLAKSAIGFLTGNLPAQAFPGYETEINSLPDFINLSLIMLSTLKEAFKNVDEQMRTMPGKARAIVLAKSFIRLNTPAQIKYGGGVRVKRVLLKDNWNKMTGQYNSFYGQDYDYTVVEKINGKDVTISSGVASYEPGIGSEENPFREILSFNNKLPLASAEYGAVEMPMLEGLYPAAGVGYSKVTIRSIHRKGKHGDSAVRSAIGKQVTGFYTARDYPAFSSYTPMASIVYDKNPFFSFLYKEIINRRTVSQGFLVETNDMHGKVKFQAAYSESDEQTPVSSSYHYYKNTGKNGLNDKVDFVYSDKSGAVKKGNLGIDVELMTDVREFKLESEAVNGQLQTDLFFIGPVIIPLFTMLPLRTYQQNLYRAVTCTKLINYHAIEDSVVVMDKGSVISTKTTAYDAETGSALVTQTANEFNDPVYNVSYPAYWAYSGTGPAYKNINMSFRNVSFYDGQIISGADILNFESGDELYLTSQGSGTFNCINPSGRIFKLWAFDKKKDFTALTVTAKDLTFIDSLGKPFTGNGVDFRILRSGRRNNLGLTISAATCMKNPLQNNKLIIDNAANVVSASAVEYKEKWEADDDVIVKKVYYTTSCSSVELDSLSCNGILEKNLNPYVKGLLGNFKPYRSLTYYGSRNDSDVNIRSAIRKNGYLANFSNYWNFNIENNAAPNLNDRKWVWNNELTKVNSKGQELETRDALNRYTAAQYGFNKNMPVSVVENAHYGEAVSEGFEDISYLETINAVKQVTCNTRYLDLRELGSVMNTNTTAVKAHTGKYMLRVNGAQTKPLTVNSGNNQGYHLTFGSDTVKTLYNTGGNYNLQNFFPANCLNNTVASFSSSSVFIDINTPIDLLPADNSRSHKYIVDWTTFIRVTVPGTYTFDLSLTHLHHQYQGVTASNTFSVSITDLNGTIKSSKTLSASPGSVYPDPFYPNASASVSVNLCAGIYKVAGSAAEYYYNTNQSGSDTRNQYLWKCTNYSFPLFKSLDAVNGCVYKKPIPATENMLNPSFRLVPGKTMQFSAWVREDCDSTVCYKPTYVKNHVELQFPGSGAQPVKIYPAGVITEGWQKVEGEFTVPANATMASLILSNDGTQNVYFDDIRLHPFNANMKSYVYDPVFLRLVGELDENNYASFYDYDEEGQLVRIKKETIQGIKTIKETRNAKQKVITDIQ